MDSHRRKAGAPRPRGLRAGDGRGDDKPITPPPIVDDPGGGPVGEDGTDPSEKPECQSCLEKDQHELGRIDIREAFPAKDGTVEVHVYGCILCKNCVRELQLTWKFLTADHGVEH